MYVTDAHTYIYIYIYIIKLLQLDSSQQKKKNGARNLLKQLLNWIFISISSVTDFIIQVFYDEMFCGPSVVLQVLIMFLEGRVKLWFVNTWALSKKEIKLHLFCKTILGDHAIYMSTQNHPIYVPFLKDSIRDMFLLKYFEIHIKKLFFYFHSKC